MAYGPLKRLVEGFVVLAMNWGMGFEMKSVKEYTGCQ